MRPTRLELAGFASFREPTTVTFEDTDLFVLTGPTGSGKSSLIDAMIFALYGSVPRYDDRRLVEPVITRGLDEARVRLDFCVGDRALTAVRVVRRTGEGRATTKEARLEEPGGQVLAGTAPEVTAAVEDILGLSFEHFTRCVVLPQGEFAEFLHARPSERQDLLVELLRLEIYRRVGRRANERAKEARARDNVFSRLLSGEYADATGEVLAELKERITDLEALTDRLRTAAADVTKLQADAAELRTRAVRLAGQATALEGVEPPEAVAALAERHVAARGAERAALEAWQAAQTAQEAAAAAREALGDRAALDVARRLRAELKTVAGRHAAAREADSAAREAAENARGLYTAARSAVDEADAALHALYQRHRAYALAKDLVPGEPCPVCGQPVATPPTLQEPAGVAPARSDLEAAKAAAAEAAEDVEAAARKAAAAEQGLATLDARRVELEEALAGTPAPEVVDETLSKMDAADRALKEHLATVKAARTAHEARHQAVEDLEEEIAKAWSRFDRTRDAVSALEIAPPEVDRADVGAAWRALAAWAAEAAPGIREKADILAGEAREIDREVSARRAALRKEAQDQGVEVGDADPLEACAAALGAARGAAERGAQRVAEAEALRTKLKIAKEEAEVAHLLGLHLKKDRFEGWLLNRALGNLAAGASEILRDISPQQPYSLRLSDDGDFLVVDHLNADEVRPAKSLSGGETFLASLSLALALAEQLAELAAEGTSRLEALFLDEGFGTLDAESLDVVAGAITELGAKGRMVGLVTHVPELAARMPVRYEVRKTPSGSVVERVVA